MYQPIQTLPGSNLHRTSVELYQRHADASNGRCSTCGQRAPCTARRHAALVIRAAAEDPRWYDGQLTSGQLPNGAAQQIAGTWPPQAVAVQQHSQLHSGHPLPGPVAQARSHGQPPADHHPSLATPGVTGFSVGGYGRRADVPYVEYER